MLWITVEHGASLERPPNHPLCVYLSFPHNPLGSYERRTDFFICAKTSVNLKGLPAKLFCIEFYHVQDAFFIIHKPKKVRSFVIRSKGLRNEDFVLACNRLFNGCGLSIVAYG